MRTWELTLGLVLASGALTGCATEEDPPGRTLSDFCAAVERAPKDDVSLARTRAAATVVEQYAPNEIREDVTTMREVLDDVSTVTELEALAEQKGALRAAERRYHEYVEVHCYSG